MCVFELMTFCGVNIIFLIYLIKEIFISLIILKCCNKQYQCS